MKQDKAFYDYHTAPSPAVEKIMLDEDEGRFVSSEASSVYYEGEAMFQNEAKTAVKI